MATLIKKLWRNQFGMSILALWCLMECATAQSLERYTFAQPHLGTIVELTIYATEETVANQAAQAASARIKELDLIFSDYKSESETMRLCETAGTGQTVKVSPELFQVLKMSLDVAAQSDGAFDVTVGPMIVLWRRARKEKRLPGPDEITAAKKCVGWKQVILNEEQQTVELKLRGMRLDFGGVAKGFIAQDVLRLLRKRGLSRSLIAVAGDIVAGDPPPGAEGWKVGVAPLKGAKQSTGRLLSLANHSVSTSGDAFQFVEIGGIRYSHIVDPETGIGLTQRSSVTIAAADGAVADAWATAVCVLGRERGLAAISKSPNIEACIVEAKDDGVKLSESPNFRDLELKEKPGN